MDKLFNEFKKTGKISDYLLYAKEKKMKKEKENGTSRRNNSKNQ